MIFYFSGTGNSLYVAKELAKATNDEAISIPMAIHDDTHEYKAQKIGLVLPVYAHDIPPLTAKFLQASHFEAEYFYIVLTYGNRAGCAIDACVERLKDKTEHIDYAQTLLMVDNWLPSYDIDEQLKIDKQIPQNLSAIIQDVVAEKKWIRPCTEEDKKADEDLFSKGFSFDTLCEQEFLEGLLSIDDLCIGCGICTRVCPSGCITLVNNKAKRDATKNYECTVCLACIHACPNFAISMPGGQKNTHAHFCNEHTNIKELCEANNQSKWM